MRAHLLFPLLALAACQPAVKEAATCPPVPAPFTIRHPAWATHATLYQINVRQYTPEGTFRAVEKHLDRLDSMGVGILWLMPVQPIGVKNRKGTLGSQYSVRDYRAVNPEFGTMADLKHLIGEAHRRKMHVILDWVANHTSWDNALIEQHPDWYTRGPKGELVPPVSDWQDVVDLDYSRPALRRYMTESMVFWVKEAGFDGFRADVAGMVPTEFWDATRAELEKIKPVFMLAEWDELHDPPFLPKGVFTPNTHLLEKAFDSNYALRLHYLIDSIAQGKKTTAALPRYFADERRMYPAGVQLMNFTSSHDVNSWDNPESLRYGPNVQPLAVLTTLLPGIPMVYSGQEAASPKKLRFFDKDTINWNGYPLQSFYTTLLQLKKRHPALAAYDPCVEFRLLPTAAGVVAFERRKGPAAVFTALNLTDAPQTVTAPAPPAPYEDVFTPKGVKPGAQQLTVEPHGWRVLSTAE
ncbi:alpha-amylase family glycosyl hydrolase [Hymenobacter sp. ASUV-10]|uniref:Alpha-amylase family glycosyl hydrolase n=1 Tax=Hymenobacter aranciens TaxID=3063996 RepID=A0ABT9BHG3_9BACT|nr:alpha-amylase family glycosyl hydrolase [Hymenobacter sp. ASUV-10]MDO7877149.1 alpha-amylase family glycosyl hydrolase [Hymenobacter sp. ASUV-10]